MSAPAPNSYKPLGGVLTAMGLLLVAAAFLRFNSLESRFIRGCGENDYQSLVLFVVGIPCALVGVWSLVTRSGDSALAAAGGEEDHDKAIAACSEAIRLHPEDAEPLWKRGAAYVYTNEFDKAIDDFTAAIRLDPEEALPYFLRGTTHGIKKEYAKAIEDFSCAIQLRPGFYCSYSYRGSVYSEMKEYEKAIEDYDRAVWLEPKDARARNGLAWLLATCPEDEIRDGKQAVDHAAKACKLTAWKDSSSLDNLAAAHAECGNFGEAIRRQKEALEIGFADAEVMEAARRRLGLYEAGKPFRIERPDHTQLDITS